MPTAQKDQQMGPVIGGKPIFAGKTALIKFVNQNDSESGTIWLADNKSKTIRPFVPETYFDSLFDNPEEARNAVVTLSSDELDDTNGMFKDFEILGSEYGVQNDGSMKPVDFNTKQVAKRYGKPSDPEAEMRSVQLLDGYLSKLKGGEMPGDTQGPPISPEGVTPSMTPAPQVGPDTTPTIGTGGVASGTVSDRVSFFDGIGGYNADITPSNMYGRKRDLSGENFWKVSSMNLLAETAGKDKKTGMPVSFVEDTLKDDRTFMFYIGAMTYGGYDFADIYADIVKKYKKDDAKILISDKETKGIYYASEAGKAVKPYSDGIIAKSVLSTWDPKVLKYSSYNMPESIMAAPAPQINKKDNPVEWQAAMDKVQTAYSDVLEMNLDAQTMEDTQAAQTAYKQFKEELDRTYGIQLEDDATKAWGQLEALDTQMAGRGIQGSGIQSEAVDDVLKMVRTQDDRIRQTKMTEDDKKKMEVFKLSATSADVQKLKETDPQKYKDWGFEPDPKLIEELSIENLTKKYPEMSKEEIQALHDITLDENNNYRSTIQKKRWNDLYDATTGIATKRKEEKQAVLDKKYSEAEDKRKRDEELARGANIYGGQIKDEITKTGDSEKPKEETQKTQENQSPSILDGAYTRGTHSTEAEQLQKWLVANNYMRNEDIGNDWGWYGPKTSAALDKAKAAMAAQKPNSTIIPSPQSNNIVPPPVPIDYTNKDNMKTDAQKQSGLNAAKDAVTALNNRYNPKPIQTSPAPAPAPTPTPASTTGTSWVKGTSGMEKWVNGTRQATMDLRGAQAEGYTGI